MVLCGLHEKKNKHKKKKKKPTGGKTCFCVSFPPRLLDRLFSFDLPLRRRRRRRWLISDAVLVALAGSASRNKKQNNQSEIVLFSFRVKTKEAAASSYYTVTTIYAIRNRWHFDIYLKMQFSLPPPLTIQSGFPDLFRHEIRMTAPLSLQRNRSHSSSITKSVG